MKVVISNLPEFQSRNGLIWTAFQNISNVWYAQFQSRNGLIWTRSDFDKNIKHSAQFQSRNGLIWTEVR